PCWRCPERYSQAPYPPRFIAQAMAAVGKNWKVYGSAPPAPAFRRVPSWERAHASSQRTRKHRAAFMPQSRLEGCSVVTMGDRGGRQQPRDWMIPMSTSFFPARRRRDSLSRPVVKAPIAAPIVENIGKKLRHQETAPSARPLRKMEAPQFTSPWRSAAQTPG